MTAVSGAHSSLKTNPPIANDNDTPSLTTRVSQIALACFAILALGFMTGNIGYSILAATAVGVGGLFWITKILKADLDKNKLEPYVDVDPEISMAQRIKEGNEKRWREMEDALGGKNAYDKLPDVGVIFRNDRDSARRFEHAISRGYEEGPKKLLFFKLQKKSGGSPFMCTFSWSQKMGKENDFGIWMSNIDNIKAAEPCFPSIETVKEGSPILETIRQLREGKHPDYKLVHPKIEVINE